MMQSTWQEDSGPTAGSPPVRLAPPARHGHSPLLRLAFGFVLPLIALLVLEPPSARAQTPEVDLRNFHAPSDPEGALYLEDSLTSGGGEWNAAAWFSYGHELLVLEGATRSFSPLEHQFSVDYTGSVGIGERLQLGAALPTVVYQTGENESALTGSHGLASAAFGDPRFDLKANLLAPGGLGGFGVAALGRVWAPLASDDSLLGNDGVSAELRALAELRLILLTLAVSSGFQYRNETDIFNAQVGSGVPWAAALHVRPQAFGLDDGGHWRWTLEAHGSLGVTPDFATEANSPALAGLSARYQAGDFSFLAGAEAALNSGLGAPLVRGVFSIGFAPRFIDADNDGIGDETDECPELAEDHDGFEDHDGCPEFDNDGDSVGDDDDRCPGELEDLDDFQDDDGCPEADNDGDGIEDTADACPNKSGPPSKNPDFNGCPAVDSDGDKVFDDRDRCPKQAEDHDGHRDSDGCPDPDNDRDTIPDAEDSCPNLPGQRRSDPKLNGCPNPDSDGDTYDNAVDRCPKQAETFDGRADDDGCPEAAGDLAAPIVTVVEAPGGRALSLKRPIQFEQAEPGLRIATESDVTLRAMARELNRNPDWVLLVGVRPKGNDAAAQQAALNQSFAIVHRLRALTHRDAAAETIGWAAVERVPQARARGIGLFIALPEAASE